MGRRARYFDNDPGKLFNYEVFLNLYSQGMQQD